MFSLCTFQFAPPDLHQQSGQQPSEPSCARNIPLTEHAGKTKSSPPHQSFPHSLDVIDVPGAAAALAVPTMRRSQLTSHIPACKNPREGKLSWLLCFMPLSPKSSAHQLYPSVLHKPCTCGHPAQHPAEGQQGSAAPEPPEPSRLLSPEELQDPGVPLPYLKGCLHVLEKQQKAQSQRQAAGSHLRWC